MTGWYLCDGRNGSPDLRGRVANGRHPDRSDYRIGSIGGNEQVQLNVNQMPYHTHLGYYTFIIIIILKPSLS
jgi:microcystin-dependent protein